MHADAYTCKTGQIPAYNEIGKTADNSKESCAAACDALGECGAFDFTEKELDYGACRLVKGDRPPRSDGGDDKRKYCEGTNFLNFHSCFNYHFIMCVTVCMYGSVYGMYVWHVCVYVFMHACM